jgi:hypothetical protein
VKQLGPNCTAQFTNSSGIGGAVVVGSTVKFKALFLVVSDTGRPAGAAACTAGSDVAFGTGSGAPGAAPAVSQEEAQVE